ncbi:MAG: hypothetical protein HOO96_41600 [Polyangiaceae bacterium]|nr:hypothetical protein [Polyangiaceae bacterium]
MTFVFESSAVPQGRGTLLAHATTFVRETMGGEEAWVRFLRGMDPADAERIRNAVAVGWYDTRLYVRTLHALRCFSPRGDVLDAFGRFSAERDVSTLYRVMLRLANPSFVVEKTAQLWSRYHDSGVWAMNRVSPTRATGELSGWLVVDEGACEVLNGYLERILQLVGAEGAVSRHVACRSRGARACTFDMDWR